MTKVISIAAPMRLTRAIRVFLVDSFIIRQRLKEFLSSLEQVEIVGESIQAHDAVYRILELEPDMVILDLQFLEWTGFDILKNIKTSGFSPVVIVLSNYPYPEYEKKCMENGADFFLDKSAAFREIPVVLALVQQMNLNDVRRSKQ